MDGVVSVYKEDIRFFCVDEKILQDKFDLLFTTARLMDCKIDSYISRSLINFECSSYFINCSSEDKHFGIVFDLLNGAVTMAEITVGGVLTVFEVDNMGNLLGKLDELLAYI